jgi:hypothetical protein
MNSISLKEAAARWGVSERRISQLASEEGSGVWRVERGRYSFDPPQKGNHTIEAAEAALYQAAWLAEKGEFKEAKKITAKFFQSEIDNPHRSTGERAMALLNLSWLEDTQLRELSGPPEQSFDEMFNGFEIGDGFSNDQWEYLINHQHFEIGLLTPEDRIELAKIIEKLIKKLLAIEPIKKRFPRLDNNEWQMIFIEIMSALLESRIKREGKDRLDYLDQASKIINECVQGI